MTQMKAWQAVEAGMALGVGETHGPVFDFHEERDDDDAVAVAACGIGVIRIGLVGSRIYGEIYNHNVSTDAVFKEAFWDDPDLLADVVNYYEGFTDGVRHTHAELADWLKQQDR